jgi:hypothetical protein
MVTTYFEAFGLCDMQTRSVATLHTALPSAEQRLFQEWDDLADDIRAQGNLSLRTLCLVCEQSLRPDQFTIWSNIAIVCPSQSAAHCCASMHLARVIGSNP